MDYDFNSDVSNENNHRYYSVDDYSAVLSRANMNFHIVNLNIRSYNSNSDELFIFLNQLPVKPDVIILTETWFTSDSIEDLSGYNAFHTFREDRGGGGVSVFVKSKYSCSDLPNWTYVGPNMEICSAVIIMKNVRVVIHAIYRPPDRNVLLFNEEISAIFDGSSQNDYVFVAGDFNIDISNPNGPAVDFISLSHASSFVPLITTPTRVTQDSASCIDHIWFNQIIDVESGVLELDITDHYPVFASTRILSDVSSHFIKKFRDHSATTLRLLQLEMAIVFDSYEAPFNAENVDLDFLTESFLEDMYSTYNRCCPIRGKRVSYNRSIKPWINDELMICIRRKHNLFRQYKQGIIGYEYYNLFKNHVTAEIRRTKRRYFAAKFESQLNNAAETWKCINGLIRSKLKKSPPVQLMNNGALVTEPGDVANRFNAYFSGVALELDNRIPHTGTSPLLYMGDRIDNSLFIAPVTHLDVADIIRQLKSKYFGLYAVPTFIYKCCVDLISPIIAELFNISVQLGRFPTALKLARVLPIYKSGDKNLPSNYRPISIMSDLSKIFEKLMFLQLSRFMRSNSLLSSCQFGFQRNSSTSDAILEFMDYVYNCLDVKKSVVSVFLDLSKAFDTVRHDILLDKLNFMGIRGNVLSWFQSYLKDRRQYVSINNSNSSHSILNSGVPQGSVLGPVLFLIYINDLSRCSNKLKFVHFADDTTIFYSADNVDEAVNEINVELIRVQDWMYANRLSLNANKTSAMVITDSNAQYASSVRISDSDIEFVDQSNFLGVVIDKNLNFKFHVNKCMSSVSKAIGAIRRVSSLVPARVRKTMYYSLVYSRVSYGVVAWGGSSTGNTTQMERLLLRARKAVIFPRVYRDGADFTGTFLNFSSIFKYFTAVKLFKVIKENCHPYFSRIFMNLKPVHAHDTRFSSRNCFNNPRYLKTKCQSSFVFRAVHVWNSISESIKNSSLHVFKRLFRGELLRDQSNII